MNIYRISFYGISGLPGGQGGVTFCIFALFLQKKRPHMVMFDFPRQVPQTRNRSQRTLAKQPALSN